MRILISGLGAVSCIGAGIREHRLAFASGRSGIAEIREEGGALPVGAFAGRVAMAGEFAQATQPHQPRIWQLLQFALRDALADAALSAKTDCAVYVGSAHGDLDSWLRQRRGMSCGSDRGLWEPSFRARDELTEYLTGMPLIMVSTACTASAVALGLAFDALRTGDADIAIVAGAESLTPFLYAGFDSLRALARQRCRPFDRHRSGLVLGEGAAAIVLETETHARQRGAWGIAELAGYGFAADAAYLTAPDPSGLGAASALRQAIGQAGFAAPPDFINAHGTGTRLNDRMECIALQRVFGSDAPDIAITSTKPLTGHLCGAAGAMEILSTAIALQTGLVPGINGFEHPDPEFDALDFVCGPVREGRVETALSMNSGFGGTNTAVALRRLEC